MQVCPFSERLAALLANELTEAEKLAVTLHVSGCYSCREQLDQMTLAPTGQRRPVVRHDDSTLPPSALGSEFRTVFPGSPSAPASAIDIPGYAIVRELGRGGMGVVYEARQLALQRTVALKVVLNGAHSSPAELARFHDEAELIARLHHPNIVQIFDVGQATHPFLVLEFAAGGSLARQLKGTPSPQAPPVGWSRPWPGPCRRLMPAASCTAISSPPTSSCSPTRRRRERDAGRRLGQPAGRRSCGRLRRSPTSVSPNASKQTGAPRRSLPD